MKNQKTIPTNNEFWNRYINSSFSYGRIGLIAQIVSGGTEIAGIYFYVLTLSVLGGIEMPKYAILAIAMVIAFAIEYTNFLFLPEAIRAIIHKEFKGDQLLMSVLSLLVVLVMMPLGTIVSYNGGKEIGKRMLDNKKLKKEIATDIRLDSLSRDSLYKIGVGKIESDYQEDSSKIESIFASTKKGLQNQIYANRKDKENGSRAERALLYAEIQKAESERDKDLLTLDKERRLSLERSKDILNNEKLLSEKKQVLADSSKKTANYAAALAWITVFFQLLFVLVNIFKVQFEKGSGMKRNYIASQYYFEQSIFSHYMDAIGNRIQSIFRRKISNIEAHTKAPPLPQGITELNQIPENVGRPIVTYKPDEEGKKEGKLEIVKNKEVEQEAEVYSLLNASKSDKDKYYLEAAKVVSLYLRTSSKRSIDRFLRKCKDHLEGKGPNPFHPQRIGFISNDADINAARNAARNASKGGGFTFSENSVYVENNAVHNAGNAAQKQCNAPGCSNIFTPNVPHHKYCSDACRQVANGVRNRII